MAFDKRTQDQHAAEAVAHFQPAPPTQHHVPTPPPDHPLASVAPAHAPATGFEGAKPTGGHVPANPALAKVYKNNQQHLGNAHMDLTKSQQRDMKQFEANYAKHKADYEKVAAQSDLPPELIAALHWRESTGNFHTYLAQGDPLGKKATHVPTNQPIRSDWSLAAEDALGAKDKHLTQTRLDLHKNTTDLAAIASYAEAYNGLGYSNKGKVSPYVWSGTDAYTGGKFVRDHQYDPRVKDAQLGVMPMFEALKQQEQEAAAKAQTPK
jgi:lysozyme family protein